MVDDLDSMRAQIKESQARNCALAEYVDDRAAAPRKEASAAAARKAAQKHKAAANDLSEAQQLYVKSLTATDQNVLRGLTERDYRTASGLAADLELPRFKVEEMLSDMEEAGLAKSAESPVTHGERYAITPVGWAALATSHKSEPVARLV